MDIRKLLASARALSYYTRAQEVGANNLANVSTDGFKQTLVAASGVNGAPVARLANNLAQGSLRPSDNPLDVAIEGEGFFTLEGANGPQLARTLSLHVSPEGWLVAGDGARVLDTDDRGIRPPDGQPLSINAQGDLVSGTGPIATLKVVTAPTAQLERLGNNRWTSSAPFTRADGLVRGGMREESNADSVGGMLSMIEVQRAYAANLEAMKALDGAAATTISDVGRA